MKFTTIRAGLSQFGGVFGRVREQPGTATRSVDFPKPNPRWTGIGGPVSRNGKICAPNISGMDGVPDFDTPGASTKGFRL